MNTEALLAMDEALARELQEMEDHLAGFSIGGITVTKSGKNELLCVV